MTAIPRDGEPQDIAEARSGLVRGICNGLMIVAVLYGGIVLAMLVVGTWRP